MTPKQGVLVCGLTFGVKLILDCIPFPPLSFGFLVCEMCLSRGARHVKESRDVQAKGMHATKDGYDLGQTQNRLFL